MSDNLPVWAMEKARETLPPRDDWIAFDTLVFENRIARALVAERERAATIAMQKPPHLNYCDCGNTDREELQNEIAAAIRNGE